MRLQCELLVLLLCTSLQVNSELSRTDELVQDKQSVDQQRQQDVSERLAVEQQKLVPNSTEEKEVLEDLVGQEDAIHNRQQRDVRGRRRGSKNKGKSGPRNGRPEKSGFPYWVFITLLPLVITLMVFIGCFVFYKRAYDKAVSETMQMKKKEQRRRRKSREEGKRHEAGLPMSALDMEIPGSDYAGFGTEFTLPKVKEGGLGSIMRDPDLDSAAREEAPRIYKMVFSGDKWRTVDEVPSNMSFEIPSESL